MEIDIAIPKLKIAIEWDGEYWHSKIPYMEERDRKKNGLIIKKGWKFIRVNDSQLSKKEIEERCENILEIIKEQNDNKYGYTGGFYI
jgi:very-short-patch-repair endonuclease